MATNTMNASHERVPLAALTPNAKANAPSDGLKATTKSTKEAKAEKPSQSLKRARDEDAEHGSAHPPTNDDNDEDNEDDEDDDDESIIITENCDQVRRKINRFIESGAMKVTEFQRALGVTSKSYNDFLRQHGPHKGAGSNTYFYAFKFFKKREEKGIPMPKKKKAKTDAAGPKGSKGGEMAASLADIHLDGEDTDDVPVLDSCDEVRRKIDAHLRLPGVTQAAFMRDLAAQFHDENGKVSGTQLSAFRGKKGPDAGNASKVYYGAYVFFEKMRLRDGKPKSKHRQEMEAAWGGKGVDTKTSSHNKGIWTKSTDHVEKDKLGRWILNGRVLN